MPLSSDMDEPFRAAVLWMVRLRSDQEDAATLRAFSRWIERSTEHRRAYARCEALWLMIQIALPPVIGRVE
ncbi:FecR/PupR family sigma factor regulator [Peristeroidobacter agariperforans]|uniref:FecR/PupR family sigma factor regulator n=1 Tax=Peristeroidobacter agariperforans TaxID=268404 RepID=UPI00101D112E